MILDDGAKVFKGEYLPTQGTCMILNQPAWEGGKRFDGIIDYHRYIGKEDNHIKWSRLKRRSWFIIVVIDRSVVHASIRIAVNACGIFVSLLTSSI